MALGRPPLPLGTYGDIRTRKISKGTWEAETRYRDIDGITRKVRKRAHTAGAAKLALKEKLQNHSGATGITIKSNMLITELCQYWINQHDTSYDTKRKYESVLKNHISKDLPNLRLNEITTGNLERYFETKTPYVAKNTKIIISSAIQLAVRENIVPINYAKQAQRPKIKNKITKRTSMQTVHDFLQFIKEHQKTTVPLYDYLVIHAYLGARTGETLALRWKDIDFNKNTVKITGTVKQQTGKGIFRQDHPKTIKGFRELKVPQEAINILINRKAKSKSRKVFPTREDTYITVNNLNRELRKIKNLDKRFKNLTPTDLRKALATFLAQASGGTAIVTSQLGHEEEKTANKHYIAKTMPEVDNSEYLKEYKIL
ncbi:MAG: site-specific integrase [Micrococcaceae bacterium]